MALVHNTTTPDIETAGADYLKRFAGELGDFFLQVQAQALAACMQELGSKPLRILEVGGGHGQVTGHLLRAGHEVVVQGSAPESFQYLQSQQANLPGKLGFIQSSLWNIPEKDKSFDLVIALRLLAHVERWKELLKEMSRVSRQAIAFDFAATSALNKLTPLFFGLKRKIEGNTRPYFSYSKAELVQEIQGLGFEPLACKKQFFFPMGLHRAANSAALSRALEGMAKVTGLTALMGSPVILLAKRPE